MFPGKLDLFLIFRVAAVFIILSFFLGGSVVPTGDEIERVRAFTRDIEFNFVNWTLNALSVKFNQSAVGTHRYLSSEAGSQILLDYLDLINRNRQLEEQFYAIYAEPDVGDLKTASADVRRELDDLLVQRAELGPLAESILQSQLGSTLKEMEVTFGGQPIPPVLYHGTPIPMALIVSPRDVIRQDANIPISPDIATESQVALEDQVDANLDVSSLVVPIGGIGVYPTMVLETNNLNWLAETMAHEWLHNFFSLRPLGMSFLTSPALRTMNETAASIAGKEIGRALIARFYPEHLPLESPSPPQNAKTSRDDQPQEPPPEPVFKFNAEMRITRVTADELLTDGKIEEAETHMEERRRFFWDHGYRIRKLNQAYFAFYGAYADVPGGPAGDDPVGEAVRTLRAQSPTLAGFLNRISLMSSFEQLQEAVRNPYSMRKPS